MTGEELTLDDLVDLKSSRLVRPRPPTQTSVPALLATFQNEWDAIALETYELKKQLAQIRQELSTALYDYEGALRILARVTKERDDARAALSKVQVGASSGGAESMDIDGTELSEDLSEVIDATQKRYESILNLSAQSLICLDLWLQDGRGLYQMDGSPLKISSLSKPKNQSGQSPNTVAVLLS